MLRNVIAAGDFGPAVPEWIKVVRTVALEATFEI